MLDDGEIEAIEQRAKSAGSGDTYESRWEFSYEQDVPRLLADRAALLEQVAEYERNYATAERQREQGRD